MPIIPHTQATLPCSRHRLVSLAVMETYVRYSRVLTHHQAAIPMALTTFLDDRGMGHPSEVWVCVARGMGHPSEV